MQGGNYVIIRKEELCLCGIFADTVFLQENIATCTQESPEIHIKFTVNMAVLMFFPELEYKYSYTGKYLSDEPQPEKKGKPKVQLIQENDVASPNRKGVRLSEAIQTVQEQRLLFASKGDKALTINDPKHIMKSDNKVIGFVFIAGIFALVGFLLVIIIHFKGCQTQSKLSWMQSALTKVMGAAKLADQVGQATAQQYDTQSNTALVGITWYDMFIMTGMIVSLLVGLFIVYKICKCLCKYLTSNFLWLPQQNNWKTFSKFISKDFSDLVLEVTSEGFYETSYVYLGSFIGYPTNIKSIGVLLQDHVTYDKHLLYDKLYITWQHVSFDFVNTKLFLPPIVSIPFWEKQKCRKLFKSKNLKFRILVTHNGCVKFMNDSDCESAEKEMTDCEESECDVAHSSHGTLSDLD